MSRRSSGLRLALLLVPLLPLAAPSVVAAAPYEVTLAVTAAADGSESMELRIRYDTDAYGPGPFRDLCLPTDAAAERGWDDQGDFAVQSQTNNGRTYVGFTTHYGVGQGMRNAYLSLRRTPTSEDARYAVFVRRVDPCVWAPPLTRFVDFSVRVPPGFTIVGTEANAVPDGDGRGASLRRIADRPWFGYAYAGPPGSGVDRLDEGLFHVYVATSHRDEARVVAAAASALVASMESETGLRSSWPTFTVKFPANVDAQAATQERGCWCGYGVVSLAESLIVAANDARFPYGGARTLLHEIVHAVTTPDAPTDNFAFATIEWFAEGAAVHGERQYNLAHPGAPAGFPPGHFRLADLIDVYRSGSFTFRTDWSPVAGTSEEILRGYHYNDFVVSAYVQRIGAPAYRAVWADVHAAAGDATRCPCDSAFLEASLMRHAGGALTREELYAPYKTLLDRDETAFRTTVRCLVLPDDPDAPADFCASATTSSRSMASTTASAAATSPSIARPRASASPGDAALAAIVVLSSVALIIGSSRRS